MPLLIITLVVVGLVLWANSRTPTRLSPGQRQPYIRSVKTPAAKRLVNHWWSKVFYNNDNLQRLAGGGQIYTKPGYGLIYCYVVRGTVRYVGQTRENSLKWRMTKKQASGHLGYRPVIKKNLLNAHRQGALQIKTELVPLAQLDRREQALIAGYSPTNRLWNVEHNPHFQFRNYMN